MKKFEIEQKFRLKNSARLRLRLKRLGARKLSGGTELNEFYDFNRALRRKGSILRLRRKPGGKSLLTLKGPRIKATFSKRLELETFVDFNTTQAMLRAIGFRKIFSYRKSREEYRLHRCLVVIDYVPRLGKFFEIEGREKDIRRLIQKLDVHTTDREDRTYLEMLAKRKFIS